MAAENLTVTQSCLTWSSDKNLAVALRCLGCESLSIGAVERLQSLEGYTLFLARFFCKSNCADFRRGENRCRHYVEPNRRLADVKNLVRLVCAVKNMSERNLSLKYGGMSEHHLPVDITDCIDTGERRLHVLIHNDSLAAVLYTIATRDDTKIRNTPYGHQNLVGDDCGNLFTAAHGDNLNRDSL